jgi:hypothetical protein
MWNELRNHIFLGSEPFVTNMQAEIPPGHSLEDSSETTLAPLTKG